MKKVREKQKVRIDLRVINIQRCDRHQTILFTRIFYLEKVA